MALTTYLTVNGTIYSQKKNGVRTHFIHDALGSVAATVNDGGSVVNKYTYKPSGELLSKTGVGEDPKFLWVGGPGYRTTGRRWAEKYVRRRHYGDQQGMWTTVDPLWPSESAYVYVSMNQITKVDPSGLKVENEYRDRCTEEKKRFRDRPWVKNVIIDCVKTKDCNAVLSALDFICSSNRTQFESCAETNCDGYGGHWSGCIDNFCAGTGSITINCPGRFSQGCCNKSKDRASICSCYDVDERVVHLCNRPTWPNGATGCTPFHCGIVHELMHICGLSHYPKASEMGFVASSHFEWSPDSAQKDCLCTTCVEKIPGCESFKGWRGVIDNKRLMYSSKDCNKLPSTSGTTCLI